MDKPHKKLDVWSLSMELVSEVYALTKKLPEEEKFGLCSQMRRAAISIPSNIAEGAARNTGREFIQFLHIAQGSLSELDAQIDIAVRIGYFRNEDRGRLDIIMERVDKMLTGLIKSKRSPRA